MLHLLCAPRCNRRTAACLRCVIIAGLYLQQEMRQPSQQAGESMRAQDSARVVALEGKQHVRLENEPSWWADELSEFKRLRRSSPWGTAIQRLIQRRQWSRWSWLPMADEPLTWKPQRQRHPRGCKTAYGSDREEEINAPLGSRSF